MTLTINNYQDTQVAIKFSSGFNTSVLNAVKNIPGRRWIQEEKIWLIPNNQKSIDNLLDNLYQTNLFNIEENEYPEFLPKTNVKFAEETINMELKKLHEALIVRHYSECTIKRYDKWVEDFLNENINN